MSKEAILNFSMSKAEPVWLQERRMQALEKMAELALPKVERKARLRC